MTGDPFRELRGASCSALAERLAQSSPVPSGGAPLVPCCFFIFCFRFLLCVFLFVVNCFLVLLFFYFLFLFFLFSLPYFLSFVVVTPSPLTFECHSILSHPDPTTSTLKVWGQGVTGWNDPWNTRGLGVTTRSFGNDRPDDYLVIARAGRAAPCLARDAAYAMFGVDHAGPCKTVGRRRFARPLAG